MHAETNADVRDFYTMQRLFKRHRREPQPHGYRAFGLGFESDLSSHRALNLVGRVC